MLRHRLAALIGAMAVVSTVFIVGGAAQAQTTTTSPYPPGTSVPSCTAGDASAGTVAVGQSIKFILCGNFTAGATITITVNGTPISVAKTPVNGAVTVDIKVLSTTAIEVDDPIQVAIACGATNTVTASGPAASGTGVSHGTFIVACASTSTASTTPSSGLAFTGGNVLMALIVAALLILLGALLVIFQRRRRQSL